MVPALPLLMLAFTGGTAPEALPKLASVPSGAKQSSESMKEIGRAHV